MTSGNELSDRARKLWQDLNECEALSGLVQAQPDEWRRACEVSDFLIETACRYPESVATLAEAGLLQAGLDLEERLPQWQAEARTYSKEADLARWLRQLRRREQFRLIWRDLVLRVGYETTVSELSAVADALIQLALDWHHQMLAEQYGVPRNVEGEEQSLIVLGMGKLGARELNVSSDIDLIFTFPENGETDGRRCVDNQTFFVRLGQKLIQALDAVTADGFVFRVDMRLRPFGSSGPLALSFRALEDYYADHGRDWERYAMIKARPVAGDLVAARSLMETLSRWIYRRYTDFGVIDSLRSMKAMIQREVQRKGMAQNIKLGAGGIRELEFIVQAFQLVRGGKEPALRKRSLLAVLDALPELELLPVQAAAELRQSYLFLRNLEHALQGMADRQTQTMPGDEAEMQRLATALQLESAQALDAELKRHRAMVSHHFEQVIAERRPQERESPQARAWEPLWRGEGQPEEWHERLSALGVAEPEKLVERLTLLRDSRRFQQLQASGRERLDHFMPVLIHEIVSRHIDDTAVGRLLDLVEAVMRRSAYLVLLLENPAALQELLRLFQESSWVATEIARAPLLLDEFLNAENLYTPPQREALEDELRQMLLRIPDEDLEAQMEALRYFKKAHVLRVAASDIRGTLALMKVSDYLTFIAESLISAVVDLAWNDLERRHGSPRSSDEAVTERDFAVIGYGKLGGIELSYGSDLDLVFLHGAATDQSTTGPKSIDNAVFFARLGQKIIHLLTARMASGDVYEVDMRLRPSGNSGLMVSSMAAFERYQREQAWTWEHQALVRARCVAGTQRMTEAFDRARQALLCAPRDTAKLLEDVLSMRQKMRDSLATKPGADGALPYFDLKQDPGGIVDIEFMVQYMAIRWAGTHPEVIRWSDNIRILEALEAAGCLAKADRANLCEFYRRYRAAGHRLALQNLPARTDPDGFAEERAWVCDAWQRLMTLD